MLTILPKSSQVRKKPAPPPVVIFIAPMGGLRFMRPAITLYIKVALAKILETSPEAGGRSEVSEYSDRVALDYREFIGFC